MLMISPLNWIEATLTFSKEENVLVLLKCQDLFIEYSIFESCLSCCFLAWVQDFSTMHSMDCEFQHQSPFKQWTELQVSSYQLKIGQGWLNINLIT